ncbi:MAG: pyruvate formate lyase family protein, partial [Nitrososphaerota archaeon]
MLKAEVEKRRKSVKPVNARIARLREESVQTEVWVCAERARLLTEFYKSGEAQGLPVPIQRALAFKYLMERVSLPLEEGQLIVGLRGTGPKRVPTYPEICVHSLADLEILHTREKMPYRVDEETKRLYAEEIIPY